jgi:hypothetical protein
MPADLVAPFVCPSWSSPVFRSQSGIVILVGDCCVVFAAKARLVLKRFGDVTLFSSPNALSIGECPPMVELGESSETQRIGKELGS